VGLGAARFHRFLDLHHRGQRVVLDVYQLGRVGGLVALLGHDHGDGLALVADLLTCDRVTRRVHLLVGGENRRDRVGGRAGDDVLEVLGREDPQDAGRLLGGLDSDALDLGVGMRAPDHREMDQPCPRQVIRVAPVSGDESRILAAMDLGSDKLGDRHHSPPAVTADRPAVLDAPPITLAAVWTDLTMFT